jgi:hypothetical protein
MTTDSATMKSKLNLLETSLSVRNRLALGLYRYKDFPHWIPFYSDLDKFHCIIISNVQKKTFVLQLAKESSKLNVKIVFSVFTFFNQYSCKKKMPYIHYKGVSNLMLPWKSHDFTLLGHLPFISAF